MKDVSIQVQGLGMQLQVGGGVGALDWYEDDGYRRMSDSDADDILIQQGKADLSFAGGLLNNVYFSHDLDGEVRPVDLKTAHLLQLPKQDGDVSISSEDWAKVDEAYRAAFVTGSINPFFKDDGTQKYKDWSDIAYLHTEEKGCWASFDLQVPDDVRSITDLVTGVIVGHAPAMRCLAIREFSETPIFLLGLRTVVGDLLCEVQDTQIKYSHGYCGQLSYDGNDTFVSYSD